MIFSNMITQFFINHLNWVWALLIVLTWLTLVYKASNRVGLRQPAITGFILTLTLQAIAASSVMMTNQVSLNFACLMGAVVSVLLYPIIILAELAALVFLFKIWPKNDKKQRRGFLTWLSIWISFSLLAFLAHWQLAARCTV